MRGGRRVRCGATGGITPCDEQSPALKGTSRALSDRAAVNSRNVPSSVSDFFRRSCQEHSGHDLAAVRHAAVASDGLAGDKIRRGR